MLVVGVGGVKFGNTKVGIGLVSNQKSHFGCSVKEKLALYERACEANACSNIQM